MSSAKELSFVVFVLHILAAAWDKSPPDAFAICKESGAIDDYLVPHYDVLHSLGANALIEDLTGYVRERGYAVLVVLTASGNPFANSMEPAKTDVTIACKERLEERIIGYLSERCAIAPGDAMALYYSSRLARQIAAGLHGIENLDYKYLAEDLLENEPELLSPPG